MAAAFAGAALLAAAALAHWGTGRAGLVGALQLTARFSFLLFWLAYAGGGLAVLLGKRFEFLKREGRTFGLAFAAAHLVHVGLVVWLCAIGAAPAREVFVFFTPPLVTIYLLALLSVPALQDRIGPLAFRVIASAGMTYIAYAFATDFLIAPFSGGAMRIALYAPFAAMSVAGPILHLLSLVVGSWRRRSASKLLHTVASTEAER